MPTSATGSTRPAFTLIELMIVLAMITIAIGLIVPRMSRSLGHHELREAAARFAHTARAARQFAMAQRRTCAIDIDLDRGTYAVMALSSQDRGATWQPAQTSWLKAGRWPASVRLGSYQTSDGEAANSGTQRVTFHPDGTSSGASVRLACEADEYTVVIHPHSGQVVFGDARTTSLASDQYDFGD